MRASGRRIAAFGLAALLGSGLSERAVAAATPKASGGRPLSSFSESSDKPIDITADRLDVAHEERIATFSGNVKAVQGDITLRTPTLKVYYEGNDRSNGTSAGRNDRKGDNGNPAIQKLEAIGGVVLQSPQETARGRHAVYDVAKRTAVVVGDVVLTRQENTIRGDRLTIDFDSGQSRMEGGTPTSTGRVHGVFQPQSRNENAGSAAPAGSR